MSLIMVASIIWGGFVGWNVSKEVNCDKIKQPSKMAEEKK